MEQIKEIYQNRIREYIGEIDSLNKRSRWYVIGKISFFLMSLYSIYAAHPEYNCKGLLFIFIFLASYFIIYWLDVRCMSQIDFLKRKRTICENEIKYIDGDFSCFNDGKDYIDISHEYSYDLDIFGKDSLFNRINRTVTRKGEKQLAYRLTHLLYNKEEIEKRCNAVMELKEMPDWRIDFLSQPFIDDNLTSMSESLNKGKGFNCFFNSYFQYVSVTITLLSLILGIIDIITLKFFIMMFLFQLSTSILLSRKVSHTNINAEKLRKEFKGYHYILELIKGERFYSQMLQELYHELFSSENNSSKAFHELSKLLNMFDQRNSEFTYVLLNGLFLYDIYLYKNYNKWTDRYLSHVSIWVDCIGRIDELVSLATYAYNNPQNVKAEIIDTFDDNEYIMDCKGIYHPFLWRKDPVENDFLLKKGNIAIVTGANMAGKSTFLRTVGVNYIIACCGAPVAARSFMFSIVSLFSSMRTTDNLSKDISYFNAELLRLKQLIEHVRSHDYTLIILDEILKGTNSKDKLNGSIMFLNEISKYNVAGIIATHDLELSKLEYSNNNIFLNYCFEIELSDDIKYSYKIERGVSKNMNATFLLKGIIQDATA